MQLLSEFSGTRKIQLLRVPSSAAPSQKFANPYPLQQPLKDTLPLQGAN
jgi:hypothetical protein